ncbi:NAD(P)-dependent dehydrogenase (short-subunit alcohol dehydrogenase family) [Jatrophihabitans sp. GAS493]|uniref:SDR family NAD(P)-dependent oxidoreductase n=1 Tax=Jatrophihabitans sp. GAS493 TaxID=1907575 RepID=UPI000BB6D665|nr:SDR family NAD(P)-dependent oxidoreductase [Jatrophihabitans sp. GAS493]SOD74803.1 NAD(P)-dependent dehydrogenase (short-subunit alcohol dehydrogenase family) [Jatrophihabitans sp. GAS493]
MANSEENRVALITGASAGLGRALADALAARGWRLIIDARHPERLGRVAAALQAYADRPRRTVWAIEGSVVDLAHRDQLVAAVAEAGRLDLLVNNASTLGPTPLPPLHDLDLPAFRAVLETNLLAPLALIQQLRSSLRRDAVIVNISSDAAVEAYPGWGAYGAAKAALDHLTRTLAAEDGSHYWYAIDPGDMRTEMHQAAFPGEDISDRPRPESVVPQLLGLLDPESGAELPSGRYRAADLAHPASSDKFIR